MSRDLDHVFTFYVQCTPAPLWNALLDPDVTPHWAHGLRVLTEGRPGDAIHWVRPDDPEGRAVMTGEILEREDQRSLLHSFRLNTHDDPETRVRFRIDPEGDVCRLVVTHVGFDDRNDSWHETLAGWPRALSALKTWLETGEELGRREAAAD
mgnify:CR=1 FL=1